ncbi:TLC domain-containing protein [Pseudoscourfieldia marina]
MTSPITSTTQTTLRNNNKLQQKTHVTATLTPAKSPPPRDPTTTTTATTPALTAATRLRLSVSQLILCTLSGTLSGIACYQLWLAFPSSSDSSSTPFHHRLTMVPTHPNEQNLYWFRLACWMYVTHQTIDTFVNGLIPGSAKSMLWAQAHHLMSGGVVLYTVVYLLNMAPTSPLQRFYMRYCVAPIFIAKLPMVPRMLLRILPRGGLFHDMLTPLHNFLLVVRFWLFGPVLISLGSFELYVLQKYEYASVGAWPFVACMVPVPITYLSTWLMQWYFQKEEIDKAIGLVKEKKGS